MQPPTHNRDDAVAAIDRFTLQRGTAIGSGILTALTAIFEGEEPIELAPAGPDARRGTPLGQAPDPSQSAREPVEAGSYRSAVIILLSDGQATTGPDPMETARLAADRGIRVYTVGLEPRAERPSASKAGPCGCAWTRRH